MSTLYHFSDNFRTVVSSPCSSSRATIGSQAAAPAGWTWRAIAQANAAISRAIAAVTRFAFLPAATRRRYRAHSRSCAFHAIVRTASGTPLQPGLDRARDPRREAVAPGALDQHPP